MNITNEEHRSNALKIFNAAIAAVQPSQLLPAHVTLTDETLSICEQTLSLRDIKNIYIVGAGKASAGMAVELERILGGLITGGLVVTKYQHAKPTSIIKVVEAAHPVPDEKSVEGAELTKTLLRKAQRGDVVICLLSGGTSSLWCDVPDGLTLVEIQSVFDVLLKSGAGINEMNTVRKHLSLLKGGQLIEYCNEAKVFSLIISDVPNDDLSVIASGPTIPDSSTFGDVVRILLKYDLFSKIPKNVLQYICDGLTGTIPETPKPGNKLFQNTFNSIIGSNSVALKAASQKAKELGYNVLINEDLLSGLADEVATKIVSELRVSKEKRPFCFLQGGETTVVVKGNGKGGRNQHLALAALSEMVENSSEENIVLLCGGTDGTDGPTDAAGAIVDKSVLAKTKESGLRPKEFLSKNDAYHFFEKTNGLLITGPTGTNVMDILLAICF